MENNNLYAVKWTCHLNGGLTRQGMTLVWSNCAANARKHTQRGFAFEPGETIEMKAILQR